MNITKKGLPWTEKEDSYLKGAYRVFPVEQIAEDLGRTVGSVRFRACKLKLTIKPNLWTKEEIAYLEREYQFGTELEKMEKFLERDARLIISKANSLGFKRPEAWLDCEDDFLIESWRSKIPYKVIAEKLDKSSTACACRIYELKKKGVIKNEV